MQPSTHETVSETDVVEQVPAPAPVGVAERTGEICRNCGRDIRNALEQYCGLPDCEERAAILRIS